METIPGIVQRSDVVDEIGNKLGISFTTPEHDLMLLQMYRQNHNIKKLPTSPLFSFLDKVCSKASSRISAKASPNKDVNTESLNQPSNPKDPEPDDQYEEDYNEEEEKFESANIPSRFPAKEQHADEVPAREQSENSYQSSDFETEESEAKEEDGFENITQEQMVDIAQKVFFNLASCMVERKMTARKLYANDITKQVFNGEEMEVIGAESFIQGISKLGLTNLQPIEYACLIKVLAVNEEGEFIKVEDLMQILEDYGIKEQNEVQEETRAGRGKSKDLLSLDKFSMILLLALTEYLLKSNTPLYDLFGDKIKRESITVKSKERKVELIESKDFFEVLGSIGIQLEDDENEELKKALSFNHKQFANKISVKKLKNAIEQFAFNDELRRRAQECYEAFIEEEEMLEKEGHDTIKEQPE